MTDVSTEICGNGEMEMLSEFDDFESALCTLFCAKEAVYKCIYPTVRKFVSFQEVRIFLDNRQQQFRVIWHDDVHTVLDSVSGFWVAGPNLVAAIATLPRVQPEQLT